MLTKHLTSIPYTKFILIEDTVNVRGIGVFRHIINDHASRAAYPIHYFVIEDNLGRVKSQLDNDKLIFHDLTPRLDKLNESKDIKEFMNEVSKLESRSVLLIDSLALLIYRYGLGETYKAFHDIVNKLDIMQVVAVLHTDLLLDNEDVVKYLEHISTLSITMEERTVLSSNQRVSYTYKKPGGRIIKQIEEFWFENDVLFTKAIEKPNAAKLVEENINTVSPENLSTFKISLTEKDKELRDQLTLPYLPKPEAKEGEQPSEGKVFYKFDDVDDWDEEDPDDDLDI